MKWKPVAFRSWRGLPFSLPSSFFSPSCFIPSSRFQSFSKPDNGFLTELIFSKICELNWFHSLHDFVAHYHIPPQISVFQVLIYLMVFYTGVFPYHPPCLLPWAFPSYMISWKHDVMAWWSVLGFLYDVYCFLMHFLLLF